MTPLEPIAWIALVARWVEVARASRTVANADPRLRDSIAPLIAIESTTAALGELARVAPDERAHARDLAEITVRDAARELDGLWRGEEWPPELHAACEAAERALRHAIYAGLEELVVTGEGAFVVPELGLGLDAHGSDESPQRGTLAAMPPGSIAMPGEPVAWWCGRAAPEAGDPRLVRRLADAPIQVYRELDERGRFVRDRIASIELDVEAGLPMLTPLLLEGIRIGRFLHPSDAWLAMQRAALGERNAIPVDR